MNISFLSEKTSRPISTFINSKKTTGQDGELEVKIGNVAETMEAENAAHTITRVSVASNGTQGNWNSDESSISADGRYVAFSSLSSNLVSGDTNGDSDVFVYDTVTNTTRRVSVASDGTQGNWDSYNPSISADGRYVAFYSWANNLVSGDTNGTWDVFVYDTVTNTTRRVSVASDGTQGNRNSDSPSISADGRYVAFSSNANNLVSGDTNFYEDVFVYDTVTNTTRRVSVASDGTQGNDSSGSPSISADGRYVAFVSYADNLVSGETNYYYTDIFLYDTVTNTTRRVSVASDGTQGNKASGSPSISADGRYVAFSSEANNLVSGDTNGDSDIFVYDTVTNTTRRVSVASDGTQGNSYSSHPSISADGRYVAFNSYSSNLVSGDTNIYEDVFVYDTVANTTSRVSISSDGIQGDSHSKSPSISADGSRVAFVSYANNLVSGETNYYSPDIFLYDSGSVNVPQNPWTGTSGDDTYTYTGSANFAGNGLAGNDIIVGGIGNDYILGDTGNDLIIGGLGDDTIGGDDDNDFLYGGRNNDILVGEGGSDFLWGGFGNDVLVGYWLTVGEIDTLIGGRGSDTFGVGVSFAHFGGSGGIVGYTDSGNADYALIKDFSTSDFIELYGNINQYTFGSANLAGSDALDTTIYGNGINGLDLIAVVQDVTNVPVDNLVFFT